MMARPIGILMALTVVAACGSDPAGPGNNSGNPGVAFIVNGTNFYLTGEAFNDGTTTVGYDGTAFVISSVVTGFPESLLLSWIDDGARTYSAGSAYEVRAFFTRGTLGWAANKNKGSGSIIVTSRTSSRIKGTFSFALDPDPNAGQGTLTISSGSFDLAY
jgi:hypothetical protein